MNESLLALPAPKGFWMAAPRARELLSAQCAGHTPQSVEAKEERHERKEERKKSAVR